MACLVVYTLGLVSHSDAIVVNVCLVVYTLGLYSSSQFKVLPRTIYIKVSYLQTSQTGTHILHHYYISNKSGPSYHNTCMHK